MDSSIISVESGDTLFAIAANHGTTVDALVEANGIADPNLIYVGQDLYIPAAPSPAVVEEPSVSVPEPPPQDASITVNSGDTLSEIAQDYGTTVDALAQANGIEDPNVVAAGAELVVPVITEGGTADYQPYPEYVPESLEQAPPPSDPVPPDTIPEIPEAPPAVPDFDPEWLENNIDPNIPEAPETEDRFNDVTGDQSDIYGFDLSTNPEADALYGYVGEDGEGAWTAGAGVVDWENSDPDGWLSGFEILTAEAKGNLFGTFEPDDFVGAGFDAQVFETDLNISGHSLNFGYLNADGNLGGDSDGYGVMFNANIADIQYSNGAPSAENDNDFGVNAGLSLGLGGGLNFVYSDPDNDGITNLGFDISAGPVDFGITSEYLGAKAEDGLESAGTFLTETAHEIDDAIDTVGGWLSGDGLFSW